MTSLWSEYLVTFVYILIFNAAVLSLTVFLHEFGHFAVGIAEGCAGNIVLIDSKMTGPYTSLECQVTGQEPLLAMGCFFFTVPLSLLFLLLGNLPESKFFFVVLGLQISTASLDLTKLTGLDANLSIWLFGVIGVILILYGEILLVNRKINFIESISEDFSEV